MLKTTALMLTAALTAALLTSCSFLNNADNSAGNAETLSRFELEADGSDGVFAPLREGCYTGKDYVVELVFTGNSTSNSYNAILSRRDTGVTVFTGTAFEISSDSDTVVFFDSHTAESKLTVKKSKISDSLLNLTMSYQNRKVDFVSDKYTYSGDSFIPENKLNGDCLNPGIYDSENGVFLLEIKHSDGLLKFDITDKFNGEQVFLGALSVGDAENFPPVKNAVLMNVMPGNNESVPQNGDKSGGSERAEFGKKNVNGKACVDVVAQSGGKTYGYSGIYYCRVPEYMDDGIYKCGSKTVKLSSVTVRNGHPDAENKFIRKIMLIDEKGDVVFTGTEEVDEKQHQNFAQFTADKGKLMFFKGFRGEKEYIEVMNMGYIKNTAIAINERYELQPETR